ncbi:MAG: FTR1 family iron permease [Anaerolineae bacterium]|nr:FTR1 family iron permease [Gloeobacterales cyanobacterium ES-bin-313]
MDFSAALPTFVITLREGVEAALVVGIILAYLKKAERPGLNIWVWGGVGTGLAASVLVGIAFGWLIQGLSAANPQYATIVEPLLEGVFSFIAIVMLSWMLIWMTKQARFLKGQVEGSVAALISQEDRAGWGIFGLVLFAVLREGFESVLFIAARLQEGPIAAFGAVAGVATAVLLGALLFRWGVKLNIRLFFKGMGVLLLLIVSGLVVTALARFDAAAQAFSQIDRQSESICFFTEHFARHSSCILGPAVWDTSRFLGEDHFPGVILASLFGYVQHLYLVQALGYVLFLALIGGFYFRSLNAQPAPKPEKVLARSGSAAE